jgi:hypothetical protein
MPGGDGTGPIGRGPMTGRAAGLCAGYTTPGYTTPVYGRCLGRGVRRGFWGHGRGFWWRDYSPEPYYSPAPTKEEEKTYLENMIKNLNEEIKSLQDRIQEISKEKKDVS